MDNFNEKMNCCVGYNTNSKEFLIYRRGSIVPCFRIPAELFENFFGLKENFSEQYEKVFVVFENSFGLKENFSEQYENIFVKTEDKVLVKTEDAKPVQDENDHIDEAKRNVELCKDSIYSTKRMIDLAIDLMQGAIVEIEDNSEQAVRVIQESLIDIENRKRELDAMLDKLTQK